MKKPNISWLTDNLATGGDLSPHPTEAVDQAEQIIGLGVNLVIDMRCEADDAELWDVAGIPYVHLPTDDAYGHHIPTSLFDMAVGYAVPVIDAGGKVLIHCHMGINRGPSTAMAVLMEAYDMRAIKAFDLIREKRPIAAIAYAEDALRAHAARNDWSSSAWNNERDDLDIHVTRVMNGTVVRHIKREIERLHQEDADAYQAVRSGSN